MVRPKTKKKKDYPSAPPPLDTGKKLKRPDAFGKPTEVPIKKGRKDKFKNLRNPDKNLISTGNTYKSRTIGQSKKELGADRTTKKTLFEEAVSKARADQTLARAEGVDLLDRSAIMGSQTPATPEQIADVRRQEENRQAGRKSYQDTGETLGDRKSQLANTQEGLLEGDSEVEEGILGLDDPSGKNAGMDKEIVTWGEGNGIEVDWGSVGRVAGLSTLVAIGSVGGAYVLASPAIAQSLNTLRGISSEATRLVSSRGLSSKTVAEAAKGKAWKGLGSKYNIDRLGRATINTKTASKALDYISSMAKQATSPQTVTNMLIGASGLAIFAGGFWGPDTKADTGMSYSIMANQAAEIGTPEGDALVKEISEAAEYTDSIVATNPFNFPGANANKWNAQLKGIRVAEAKVNSRKQKAPGASLNTLEDFEQ